MQRLQQIKNANALTDIIKAIAYNYPGLHKAEELQPPHWTLTKAQADDVTAVPPSFFTLELSITLTPLHDGLKQRIDALLAFLEMVRKPMYIKVTSDGILGVAVVTVWDDNSK